MKNLETCIFLVIIILASTVSIAYAFIPSTEKRIMIRGEIYPDGTFFIDRWDRIGGFPEIPLDNPGSVRVHYLDAHGSKIAETGFPFSLFCVSSHEPNGTGKICFDYMIFTRTIPDVKGVTKFEIVLTSDAIEIYPREITPEIVKDMMENLSPEFKTPKQQTNVGILPNEVQCKEGLQLIFKSTDGSPACVKPKTAEKLIERGWAK